jgi:hypothetical protein
MIAEGIAENSSSSSSSSSSSIKEKTLVPWQERLTVFWNAYPRKKGKGNVEKWFKRVNPSQELLETITTKIALLKTAPEWLKENGQFIPYPYTFLNAKGWEDEVANTSPCQSRIQDGRFLKFCGKPGSYIGGSLTARCDEHGGNRERESTGSSPA